MASSFDSATAPTRTFAASSSSIHTSRSEGPPLPEVGRWDGESLPHRRAPARAQISQIRKLAMRRSVAPETFSIATVEDGRLVLEKREAVLQRLRRRFRPPIPGCAASGARISERLSVRSGLVSPRFNPIDDPRRTLIPSRAMIRRQGGCLPFSGEPWPERRGRCPLSGQLPTTSNVPPRGRMFQRLGVMFQPLDGTFVRLGKCSVRSVEHSSVLGNAPSRRLEHSADWLEHSPFSGRSPSATERFPPRRDGS